VGLGVRIGSLPSGQTSLFVGLGVVKITGLAVKADGILDGELVGVALGVLVMGREVVGTGVTASGDVVGMLVPAAIGDAVGTVVAPTIGLPVGVFVPLVTGGLVVDETVGSDVIGGGDIAVVGDGDPGVTVGFA
jgi:hypothetical protein